MSILELLLIGAGVIGILILWIIRYKAGRPDPDQSDSDSNTEDSNKSDQRNALKKIGRRSQYIGTTLIAVVLVGGGFLALYIFLPDIWLVYWGDQTFFWYSIMAVVAIIILIVVGESNPNVEIPFLLTAFVILMFLVTGTLQKEWLFGKGDDWADLECEPDTIVEKIPEERFGEWYIELKRDNSQTIIRPRGGARISWKPCSRSVSWYNVWVLPRHTETEWRGPFKYFPGMKERPKLGLWDKIRFEAPGLPQGKTYVMLVSVGPYRGG